MSIYRWVIVFKIFWSLSYCTVCAHWVKPPFNYKNRLQSQCRILYIVEFFFELLATFCCSYSQRLRTFGVYFMRSFCHSLRRDGIFRNYCIIRLVAKSIVRGACNEKQHTHTRFSIQFYLAYLLLFFHCTTFICSQIIVMDAMVDRTITNPFWWCRRNPTFYYFAFSLLSTSLLHTILRLMCVVMDLCFWLIGA